MKYQKKPVVIEAIQFTRDNFEEIQQFTNGKAHTLVLIRTPGAKGYCTIDTLKGPMRALEGDYIIKGIQGEFYACKTDIFMATYEEVSE